MTPCSTSAPAGSAPSPSRRRFGEFGPGNGAYYLATAFGEIYLQPSGDVGLTGILAEVPFVRGTLDKLGVTPRFGARAEYKNAVNTFTEKKLTEPHREAMTRLVDSQFGQIVHGIAAARGLWTSRRCARSSTARRCRRRRRSTPSWSTAWRTATRSRTSSPTETGSRNACRWRATWPAPGGRTRRARSWR